VCPFCAPPTGDPRPPGPDPGLQLPGFRSAMDAKHMKDRRPMGMNLHGLRETRPGMHNPVGVQHHAKRGQVGSLRDSVEMARLRAASLASITGQQGDRSLGWVWRRPAVGSRASAQCFGPRPRGPKKWGRVSTSIDSASHPALTPGREDIGLAPAPARMRIAASPF
jgi:hypothetical protein